MFLSTSSSSAYQQHNYVPQATTNHVKDEENLLVCEGKYSGSDSNYYTYKSNCYPMMSERCAENWDESCDLYLNNANGQEARLFLNTVQQARSVSTPSYAPPQQCVRSVPIAFDYQQRMEMEKQRVQSSLREQYDYVNHLRHAQQRDIEQEHELALHQPNEIGTLKQLQMAQSFERQRQLENEYMQGKREVDQQRIRLDQAAQLDLSRAQAIPITQPSLFELHESQLKQQMAIDQEQIYQKTVHDQLMMNHFQEEEDRIQLRKQEEERLRIIADNELKRLEAARQFQEQERIRLENEAREQYAKRLQDLEIKRLQEQQNRIEEERLLHEQIKNDERNENDFYNFMTKVSDDCNASCDVSKILAE